MNRTTLGNDAFEAPTTSAKYVKVSSGIETSIIVIAIE